MARSFVNADDDHTPMAGKRKEHSIMNHFPDLKRLVAGACACVLAGCGGGSGSGSDGTGTLNLAITDAPVDDVAEVWVQFTGVEVKPRVGEAIVIDFAAPLDIDLLALSGENSASLLDGERLSAGEYNWLALAVNAEVDGTFDSYAVMNDGSWVELEVPSGSRQGLRLVSGFTITANQNTSFVIDWDLRKGLSDPVGQEGLHLRPALRIVDMTAYGSISGTVADALVMDASCDNDLAENRGNLVYVFEGADAALADISGSDQDPLTTGIVAPDAANAGAYSYSIPFLSPGDYTVAFTCQGLSDDPVAVDSLTFTAPQNTVVVDGEAAPVDFE
jgi:hypothetical protein